MKVKIDHIKNKGNADEEYILLQALEDVNIGNYAIIDRTFDSEGNPTDVFRHFFRFPSQKVNKGEYISLWTKKAKVKYLFTTTQAGNPVHRFFWGSNAAVWNDGETDAAELLYVSTVDSQKIEKIKKQRLTIKRPPRFFD